MSHTKFIIDNFVPILRPPTHTTNVFLNDTKPNWRAQANILASISKNTSRWNKLDNQSILLISKAKSLTNTLRPNQRNWSPLSRLENILFIHGNIPTRKTTIKRVAKSSGESEPSALIFRNINILFFIYFFHSLNSLRYIRSKI